MRQPIRERSDVGNSIKTRQSARMSPDRWTSHGTSAGTTALESRTAVPYLAPSSLSYRGSARCAVVVCAQLTRFDLSQLRLKYPIRRDRNDAGPFPGRLVQAT